MILHDHLIPASVLLSRFEKHEEEMRASLAALPRRRFLRRRILMGSIATYRHEIESLLAMTARSNGLDALFSESSD